MTLIDFNSNRATTIVPIAIRNAVRARDPVLFGSYGKQLLREGSFNGTSIPFVVGHTFEIRRAFFCRFLCPFPDLR